jgi:hypothetical protein
MLPLLSVDAFEPVLEILAGAVQRLEALLIGLPVLALVGLQQPVYDLDRGVWV